MNSLLSNGLCLPKEKGNDDMIETWKAIPGFEGIYEASSFGRIRSSPGKVTSNARYSVRIWKTRVLKPKNPVSNKRHDLRVTLWKDGRSKDYLVSRLVASAWHGVPDERMTVNHKNGNYLDNRPSNLEWVSLRENIQHGFRNGLYSAIQQKVYLIDGEEKAIRFQSMEQAGRFLGRSTGYISNRLVKGYTTAHSVDGKTYQICKDQEVAI